MENQPLTKEQALELYGTPLALSKALGITRTAVYLWKAGKPIPKEHDLRIRYELKPILFNRNP